MADTVFLKGIRLFRKKDNQPDFVLATGVITIKELAQFIKDNPQYQSDYNGEKQIRIQIATSRDGNPYLSVDTWKPNDNTAQRLVPQTAPSDDQGLPF